MSILSPSALAEIGAVIESGTHDQRRQLAEALTAIAQLAVAASIFETEPDDAFWRRRVPGPFRWPRWRLTQEAVAQFAALQRAPLTDPKAALARDSFAAVFERENEGRTVYREKALGFRVVVLQDGAERVAVSVVADHQRRRAE